MAAPATTARQTPAGIKLKNGFSSKVAFAADPDVSLWEIAVKPPGMDGGDAINTTTMFNSVFRTFAAGELKTMTDMTFRFAYDPNVITQLDDLINVETAITVHFPDGTTWAFFLRSCEFDELQDNVFPTGNATVTCTNSDPITGAEEGPVVVNVPGT
jgi:hypothetical protein